jgi:ABC-type sugar transport system substrate-binding protein
VSVDLGGRRIIKKILAGAAGNSITIGRNEGFKQRLAEKYSDISILALQYTNWTKEDALSIMEALILANPKKIDAVYCHADNLAAGAIIAVEEAGLLGKIKVIGIGNSVEGNENLRNGKMYGTLHQSPKMEGYTGVETMVKYLNGEKVERSITVPRPKMTKENADKYAPEW